MKKQLFLSTVLLLSCVVRADEVTTIITPENVAYESVKPENIVPENVNNESVKTESIAPEKAKEVNVAEIIEANMQSVTENCDAVFLNFKISKNKENYDKQTWEAIIKSVAVLIAAAQISRDSIEKGDRVEEINKILNKSYEFLVNSTKLTGDANGVYGGYSIHLDIPQEYAQTIFPATNPDANKQ